MQGQSDCNNFELAQETLDVARVIESQNVTFDSQGQGKRILTGTKNMLQLNSTKFPCILLYFMDAINGKRF